MSRIARRLLAIALALAIPGGARAEGEKITLGYTGVNEYMAAFVAADQGFFAAHQLDVALQLLPNGGVIPPALLSGTLQVGGITAPLLLQASAGGLELGVIAGASVVKQTNPNGSALARNGTNIHAPADFVGKRVGVSAVGSFYHVLFRQFLADEGVNPDQVTFVEVPFLQMGDLLRNGQLDAVTTTQPFLGRMLAAGYAYEVSPFTAHFPNGTLSNVYVATKSWAAAHPEAVAGLRAALAEAVAYIPAHRSEAEAAEAHWLKLTPELVKALPFSNYDAVVTPGQIADWNRMARNQHLIDVDVDASALVLR
jgi:NitT/TauT family transport system substrate-binding protein